jgi:hypothetical protein
MAREAGLFTHKEVQPELERFAELVRADERARMAEQPAQTEVIAGRTVKVDWKTQALELRELVRLGGIKIAELEAALVEQPAQQEPCKACNGTGETETGIGMMVCDECHGTTYTSPPAQRTWVGLTDDEILKLAYPIRWQEVDDFEADKAVNFAQAIEAKLKEKNNG